MLCVSPLLPRRLSRTGPGLTLLGQGSLAPEPGAGRESGLSTQLVALGEDGGREAVLPVLSARLEREGADAVGGLGAHRLPVHAGPRPRAQTAGEKRLTGSAKGRRRLCTPACGACGRSAAGIPLLLAFLGELDSTPCPPHPGPLPKACPEHGDEPAVSGGQLAVRGAVLTGSGSRPPGGQQEPVGVTGP